MSQPRSEVLERSGVALLVVDGATLHAEAKGEGITRATRFNVASLGKMFTALAVVEHPGIALDDPIGRHVQGLHPETAERVTVEHCLTHRSGLGNAFDVGPDDAPAFPPGSRVADSNAGFVLLGRLLDSVAAP